MGGAYAHRKLSLCTVGYLRLSLGPNRFPTFGKAAGRNSEVVVVRGGTKNSDSLSLKRWNAPSWDTRVNHPSPKARAYNLFGFQTANFSNRIAKKTSYAQPLYQCSGLFLVRKKKIYLMHQETLTRYGVLSYKNLGVYQAMRPFYTFQPIATVSLQINNGGIGRSWCYAVIRNKLFSLGVT